MVENPGTIDRRLRVERENRLHAANSQNPKLDLSVILPIYNEEQNIQPLFGRLFKVLEACRMWVGYRLAFGLYQDRGAAWSAARHQNEPPALCRKRVTDRGERA